MTIRGSESDVSSPALAGSTAATVARRLDLLRRLYVPESDGEARARLARERPLAIRAFDVAAAARLEELRALCELASYLQRGRRQPGAAGDL